MRVPSSISGTTFSQAKLFANAEFGCGVLTIIHNVDKCKYDIYVVSPLDKAKAKAFKEGWDNIFRIIPVSLQDSGGHQVTIQKNKTSDKLAPSTIKGVTYSQAKRNATNKFGEDLIKVVQNTEDRIYDVYVSSLADKKTISEFEDNLEDRFRVIIVIIDQPI